MRFLTMAGLVVAGSMTLGAATIIVPGTTNIFGAGYPAPPLNGQGTEGTNAVLAGTFAAGSLASGITFSSVTGTTNCGGASPCNTPPIGPDGSSLTFAVGSQNGTNVFGAPDVGLSGVQFLGRQMFLVGVFLSDSTPSGVNPANLVYTSAVDSATSFSAPLLGQMFYIGDGLTGFNNGAGSQQTFFVPSTATRLFLGFADSFDNFDGFASAYSDNTGSLTVGVNLGEAVPEPGTLMLMGLGLLGVAYFRRK
jgi:PEP-CTERM motif